MNMAYLRFFKSKIAALSEPLRIGIGLGLGFALTLILVVIVMIVGFSHMAKIQTDLEQITRVNNVKTELAHIMKYAQRDRSMSLYSLALISDKFEKDEELQHFVKKGGEWWRAWEKFQAIDMNAQERVLAERINTIALERRNLMQGYVTHAMSKRGLEVSDYVRKVAIPGQEALSDEIDKLLLLQQEQANQAMVNATDSYLKARKLLLWLCSLTIVIGISVGNFVLRRVMRQSRELEHKALFDDLTGLPNRALFFDRLAQAASTYASENKPFAIAIIDLDRFKEVNDMRGHHVGDLLLKHVAQNISSTMRRSDTIARLGGDEFAMLLPGVMLESVDAIIKKLSSSLCQSVSLEGYVVDLTASMGVVCYPEHDVDITRLLLKADVAMYAAKHANIRYRIYTRELDAAATRNVELQKDLRYAIEHDQLLLHYQPKISHHSDCIMGVEALVRWNHPERGLVGPDEFIPLAEDSGLIQPLAQWVLHAALQQSEIWHAAGYKFSIAINLSTRNLLDDELPARVDKLLAMYNVRPEWLVFEITESAVMTEPIRALQNLTKLNKMGIHLSLDDFGTGYSSLAYLKKLPVSEIKIDRSFIKDMELDSNDTVIVRSTIALGHNLGMKVVAEGVENIEIWELLTSLGCDASQGYYMSRPLSAKALGEWITTSPWAQEKVKSHIPHPVIERRKHLKRSRSI